MSRANLTDLTLRSLAPRGTQRYEIWDRKLPGFGVRVSPAGTKTFVLFYYSGGRKRRFSLGRFPHLSLADARASAMVILGQLASGIDPDGVPDAPASPRRFEVVVEDFIDKHCSRHNRKSTAYATARLLRKHFTPELAGRPIGDISRRDIVTILDEAVAADTPSIANHALFAVRKFFNWCVERSIVDVNPIAGLARPAPLRTRDRVLSDAELCVLWQAAQDIGYPFGTIVQLLILTAQRRGEVAGMRWSEIDFEQGQWTIPGDRTKNKRLHAIPLSKISLSILAAVPRINPVLIFPARGRDTEVVSGFSKIKVQLDARLGVQDWTLHDLRRTAATGMAGLRIPPHVVERILNHASGTFAGVAGVYNRFGYLDEMRSAVETWDRNIDALLTRRTLPIPPL